jgi:hypothetical protein
VGFTHAVAGNADSTTWLWISIRAAMLTGGLIAALHAGVVSFRVIRSSRAW